MGMKKIIKHIEQLVQEASDTSYVDGFEDGDEAGFHRGVEAERERVQGLLKMLSENELTSGSGSRAKMYRDVAEVLAIQYDPDAAATQYDLEEDY